MTQLGMLDVPNGPDVTLHCGVFERWNATKMRDVCNVEQFWIDMRGQRIPRPRLEQWFHDDLDRRYKFGGGDPIPPQPFPEELAVMRSMVQEMTGESFDSCFVNVYRGPSDSIDWHSDDQEWIGPVIASVSLGAVRDCQLRLKNRAGTRTRKPKPGSKIHSYRLGHGDLLVMPAGTQEKWLHRVPKQTRSCGMRFSATFRQTV